MQRLLASFSGLPPGLGPRRSARRRSDRGRYPEEVGDDDDVFQGEDSLSDDEDEMDGGDAPSTVFAYKVPGGSEPLSITKPCTPAGSIRGTPEDSSVFRAISESPGGMNMDIDVVSLDLISCRNQLLITHPFLANVLCGITRTIRSVRPSSAAMATDATANLCQQCRPHNKTKMYVLQLPRTDQ